MEDEDVAICLLHSLPESFENVVVHAEMSNAEWKTFEVVKAVTNEHVERVGEKTVVKKEDPSAKAFDAESDPRKCSHCDKVSHSIDRCWSKSKRNERRQQQRWFQARQPGRKSTTYDDAIAFAVTVVCATPTGDSMRAMWTIDSGATHHICDDKCECCEVDEGDHTHMTLADGSKTKILGVGTINERVVLRMAESVTLWPKTSCACQVRTRTCCRPTDRQAEQVPSCARWSGDERAGEEIEESG